MSAPGVDAGERAAVAAALAPLLTLDLAAFRGLVAADVATFTAVLGPPSNADDVVLGWYPARRYVFPRPEAAGGLHVYERAGTVVAADTIAPPPRTALDALGEPSAILSHELLAPDAYVHEYLYAPRGLVLSVAMPFASHGETRIVRCRGIRPLARAEEYGAAYHRAVEDEEVF